MKTFTFNAIVFPAIKLTNFNIYFIASFHYYLLPLCQNMVSGRPKRQTLSWLIPARRIAFHNSNTS